MDKLGVTWTTRKVNDYKWGEREPGIMMDQYAGGPFGFNDIKRNKIAQGKLQQANICVFIIQYNLVFFIAPLIKNGGNV